MSGINRRDLFVGAGGIYASLLARKVALGATPMIPPAPVARVEVVKDSYFGETVSDAYRWMENAKDPDWLPYLKGQNAHTRAVLELIPGRAALLKRIQQLSGDTAVTRAVQRAGGRLFFEQRPAGADNFKLFVQEGGIHRVLIDPTTNSAAATHQSLDWWLASPDGKRVVYGVSRDGSEDSTLHVLNVADGADLPERITNAEGAGPSWLEDSSGFFYNQLTAAVATPERYLDSQARFHRLGTDPAADPILMKRGLDPQVTYERIQMPRIRAFEGSRYCLLDLTDVRSEARLLVAPLAEVLSGKAKWVAVAGFDDEVTSWTIDGETLYLLANKDRPRGRVLKASANAPAVATAAEVVPQGDWVIEDIHLARDGLYLRMLDGGISRLRRLGRDGHVSEIALPFDGTLRGGGLRRHRWHAVRADRLADSTGHLVGGRQRTADRNRAYAASADRCRAVREQAPVRHGA